MDKYSAANQIANAGMSSYDIAHSIFLATVEGVSGANQHNGYGFALSSVAELWNIKGTIGNPHGRTKITGRYKGMGVTENMILNVISQYPNGFSDSEPLFDDLLGIGSGGMIEGSAQGGGNRVKDGGQDASNVPLIIAAITFVFLKFFVGWGWIISIIFAFVVGGIIEAIRGR